MLDKTHLRTVQQVLGHTELKTTMRWAHLSTRHVRESVERLGNPDWGRA